MPRKLNLKVFLELNNTDIRQKIFTLGVISNFVNLAPSQSKKLWANNQEFDYDSLYQYILEKSCIG